MERGVGGGRKVCPLGSMLCKPGSLFFLSRILHKNPNNLTTTATINNAAKAIDSICCYPTLLPSLSPSVSVCLSVLHSAKMRNTI